MNIVELNEKNLGEAISLYKRTKAELYNALCREMPSDAEIEENLSGRNSGAITFLFVEKSVTYGLVTVNKASQEIENLCIDFALCNADVKQRILEFSIKQFSTITLVFVWVDSTEGLVSELISDYGFEYTGVQDYIDKQKSISRYKYFFKRKK